MISFYKSNFSINILIDFFLEILKRSVEGEYRNNFIIKTDKNGPIFKNRSKKL